MYTITLANGKKLTGLDMNGTNYVSKEKVDETIFKDNLYHEGLRWRDRDYLH